MIKELLMKQRQEIKNLLIHLDIAQKSLSETYIKYLQGLIDSDHDCKLDSESGCVCSIWKEEIRDLKKLPKETII